MRRQLGLLPLRPSEGKDWLGVGVQTRPAGGALAPGAPLFPTVDEAGGRALVDGLSPKVAPEAAATASPAASAVAAPEVASAITYDQFAAVDLRVGLVTRSERVPKKDKLLKLAVDVGEPEPRTIVAGLALSFQPEELVGKRVIVVVNLAPREFGKGLVSQGMLLATGPSEKLTLATVAEDAAPGARLK